MSTITKMLDDVNIRREFKKTSFFNTFVSTFIVIFIPLFFICFGMLLYHEKNVILIPINYIMSIAFIDGIIIICGIFFIIFSVSPYVVKLFRIVCVILMISILILLDRILLDESK